VVDLLCQGSRINDEAGLAVHGDGVVRSTADGPTFIEFTE
jgi:hypothetical protein